MADKFLRYKIIPGRIISAPEGATGTWVPKNLCNDYYPKYVTHKDSGFVNTNFVPYEQKSEFAGLSIPVEYMVVEPVLSGWGVSFENISVIYRGVKHIINHRVLEGRGLTMEDTFVRMNSMYTLEEKAAAADDSKREYLRHSWSY